MATDMCPITHAHAVTPGAVRCSDREYPIDRCKSLFPITGVETDLILRAVCEDYHQILMWFHSFLCEHCSSQAILRYNKRVFRILFVHKFQAGRRDSKPALYVRPKRPSFYSCTLTALLRSLRQPLRLSRTTFLPLPRRGLIDRVRLWKAPIPLPAASVSPVHAPLVGRLFYAVPA